MDVLIMWRKGRMEKFDGHLPLAIKTSALETVYFLFRFELELISCSRNPESEFKKNSETESELVYAHQPEHGTEFRFRTYENESESKFRVNPYLGLIYNYIRWYVQSQFIAENITISKKMSTLIPNQLFMMIRSWLDLIVGYHSQIDVLSTHIYNTMYRKLNDIQNRYA